MQFINEDDGILRLHQFLHDGLQPLFKLPTIFRSRHDQREIQSQNALVSEERRYFAVSNALRQSFYNRGLSYTGLANEYRVVFRAPAENLNHAIHFAIAADQRIQLRLLRSLRQVARKLRQKRRLTLPLRLRLVLRRPRQLFAHGRKSQPALVQDLRRKAFFFAQQPQQEVFRSNMFVRKTLRFLCRIREHAFAFIAQRQVHRCRDLLPNRGVSLDLLADRFNIRRRAQKPIG